MAGKHTAGPWFGRPHFNPIMVQGASEVGLEIAFACDGGNPKRDEYQANARLIAAAPELLEALNSVLDSLGALTKRHELLNYMSESEADQVWSAIARATQPLPPTSEEN